MTAAELINALPLSATAGALAWAVRILWRLDRRMVRVETKLGLQTPELT